MLSDKLSTNDNRAHNPNNSEDELNNEMLRLKAHLDLVEEGRLAGTPGISVEEARTKTYLNACMTCDIRLDTSRSWMQGSGFLRLVPSVISTSISFAYALSTFASPLPR